MTAYFFTVPCQINWKLALNNRSLVNNATLKFKTRDRKGGKVTKKRWVVITNFIKREFSYDSRWKWSPDFSLLLGNCSWQNYIRSQQYCTAAHCCHMTTLDTEYLSCPPPLCSGSTLTRGRLRMYNAPTPMTKKIGLDDLVLLKIRFKFMSRCWGVSREHEVRERIPHT